MSTTQRLTHNVRRTVLPKLTKQCRICSTDVRYELLTHPVYSRRSNQVWISCANCHEILVVYVAR